MQRYFRFLLKCYLMLIPERLCTCYQIQLWSFLDSAAPVTHSCEHLSMKMLSVTNTADVSVCFGCSRRFQFQLINQANLPKGDPIKWILSLIESIVIWYQICSVTFQSTMQQIGTQPHTCLHLTPKCDVAGWSDRDRIYFMVRWTPVNVRWIHFIPY